MKKLILGRSLELASAIMFGALFFAGAASAAPTIDWSTEIQVRPVLKAASAPLFAQISGHGTTLNWVSSTSAAGCVAPCTLMYNVFRGTVAGGESATPQNTAPIAGLTYFDSVTLTNSPQTFFYTVEAVETSGGIIVSSGPSNEVSVTFPGIPAPPTSATGTPK